MAVPRAAAARATATSPSGCTACTPVGEMRTGNAIRRPSTVVARSRSAGEAGRARGEPDLVEGVDVVARREALLRAGEQRGVHGCGQAPPGAPLCLGDGLEPGLAHRVPRLPPRLARRVDAARRRSLGGRTPGDDGPQRRDGAVPDAARPHAHAVGDVLGHGGGREPDRIDGRTAGGPGDQRRAQDQRRHGGATSPAGAAARQHQRQEQRRRVLGGVAADAQPGLRRGGGPHPHRAGRRQAVRPQRAGRGDQRESERGGRGERAAGQQGGHGQRRPGFEHQRCQAARVADRQRGRGRAVAPPPGQQSGPRRRARGGSPVRRGRSGRATRRCAAATPGRRPPPPSTRGRTPRWARPRRTAPSGGQ